MKKLFYLASGIILCASFLPKEVNARNFDSELFKTKETPDFLRYTYKKCKNKKETYELKRGRLAGMPQAVIGKKSGRLFIKSPMEANRFFKAICSSPTPLKMMEKGILIKGNKQDSKNKKK